MLERRTVGFCNVSVCSLRRDQDADHAVDSVRIASHCNFFFLQLVAGRADIIWLARYVGTDVPVVTTAPTQDHKQVII